MARLPSLVWVIAKLMETSPLGRVLEMSPQGRLRTRLTARRCERVLEMSPQGSLPTRLAAMSWGYMMMEMMLKAGSSWLMLWLMLSVLYHNSESASVGAEGLGLEA